MKPPVRAYASSEATQGWTAGFRAVAKRLDVRGNRAGCTKNQDAITERCELCTRDLLHCEIVQSTMMAARGRRTNKVLRRRTPGARINGMCRPGEMLSGYVLNTAVTPGPDLS
jgi:hypothetical protein